MLFSSISFIYYFLPCAIIAYFTVPNKIKNFMLFISSMFFYFYGEPRYILLMLATIFITYINALLIDGVKSKSCKRLFLLFTIVISLGALVLFKYLDFLISNVNNLLLTKFEFLGLVMPIGISFYTFQLLSYVIDVYKGNVKVQRSFLKLATYVSLFPQLIAGPIVRYETIEQELENRKHSFENFAYGSTRFVIGLSKKVLIANTLGQLCSIFGTTDEKSVVFYWMYGVAYSLQIYFDFSAYSDMAIGLGRIFGFHFLENFNYPYISKSITEFWRRWHISLGSWFRDYVYIPLGGNRKGKLRLLRNIFVVWFLTGLWHGANWNFIIWGILFGVLLIIEKFFLKEKLERIPIIFQRMYVLFFVMISFIIFNADSMAQAMHNIVGLLGLNGDVFINKETAYYLRSYAVIFVISIVGATPLAKFVVDRMNKVGSIRRFINILEPVTIIVLLIVVTAYLVDNSYNPFLYFRF